ncbi:hypothetical protein D3C72_1952340 [compost metagenome]
MNSRSAKNPTMANSTVATVSPSTQPIQKTDAIIQDVLSSPQKRLASRTRASDSGSSLACSRRLRTKAQMVKTDRMPNITRNRAPTCWVAVKLRRKLFMFRLP